MKPDIAAVISTVAALVLIGTQAHGEEYLSGKKWAGPRAGISIPGYGAWLIGFLVGISNNGLVTAMLD